MKPAYTVIQVDLTAARNATNLVPVGFKFDGVTVIQLPVGAVISLAFGDNNPFIPLLAQGQSFAFEDECGNPLQCDEGLIVTNPVGAGVAILLVSIGTVTST